MLTAIGCPVAIDGGSPFADDAQQGGWGSEMISRNVMAEE